MSRKDWCPGYLRRCHWLSWSRNAHICLLLSEGHFTFPDFICCLVLLHSHLQSAACSICFCLLHWIQICLSPCVLQEGHHDGKACPLLVVMSLFLNGHKLQNKKHAHLHSQGHVRPSVILWLCNDLCWLVKNPSVVLREKYSSLREKNKELSIWIIFFLQVSIPSEKALQRSMS